MTGIFFSLTWLERQQKKLEERRVAQRHRIVSGGSGSGQINGQNNAAEHELMRELKTSLHRAR